MATLPIGFFMPLPLPIMIPFMMWQSAAIAAGFGTYFQYAKRRVSAMSNEEFNKFSPSQGVNEMFDDIMSNIPSSFERIRGINNLILQSLADFLEDGIRFLSGKLGGQLNEPFSFTGPPVEQPVGAPAPPINPFTIFDPFPPAGAEPFVPAPAIPPSDFIGPPAPPLTQLQLFEKYRNNFALYRQKGGLLTEKQFNIKKTITVDNWASFVASMKIKYPEVIGPSQSALSTPPRRKTQSVVLQINAFTRVVVQSGENIKKILKSKITTQSKITFEKQYKNLIKSQQQIVNLLHIYRL